MPTPTTINPISADEYVINNPEEFVTSSAGKKRIAFVLDGQIYQFVLNPQQYAYELPARVNVLQTKGGAFVDDFGLGIGTITIKGQTKVADRDSEKIIALKLFKELEEKIYQAFFADHTPGLPPSHTLLYLNPLDYHAFRVIPSTFVLERDARRPFFYTYTIKLVVIENLSHPQKSEGQDSLPQDLSNFQNMNTLPTQVQT